MALTAVPAVRLRMRANATHASTPATTLPSRKAACAPLSPTCVARAALSVVASDTRQCAYFHTRISVPWLAVPLWLATCGPQPSPHSSTSFDITSTADSSKLTAATTRPTRVLPSATSPSNTAHLQAQLE